MEEYDINSPDIQVGIEILSTILNEGEIGRQGIYAIIPDFDGFIS